MNSSVIIGLLVVIAGFVQIFCVIKAGSHAKKALEHAYKAKFHK